MVPKILVALAVVAYVGLAGCTSDGPVDPAPSRVEAFPDPPHVDGPLTVELRPALPLMNGDRRCRAEPGSATLCSSDGSGGFRAFGSSGPVVIDEVRTRPSTDRTSWGTTALFATTSGAAVRRARDEATAVGGVVVVTAGEESVAVVEPADLGPRRITLLGLEKAEAWAVVDAFAKAETRSKQGM